MKCRWIVPVLLSLVFSLGSYSEPLPQVPSPIALSEENASEQPSVSQRLRDLAKKLEQATSDSQDDLAVLLSERELLSKELQRLVIEASESENDLKSIRESAQKYSQLLTSSILREQDLRTKRDFWRIGTGVAGGIAVVEAIVIAVLTAIGR